MQVIVGKGIHSTVPKGARLRDKLPAWLLGQKAIGKISNYWAPDVTDEKNFKGSIFV